MIDEKIREIDEFNRRNFKVDKGLLKLLEGVFEEMDDEIVKEPYREYTESNPPSYMPDPSKWVNDIVYNTSNKQL